MEENPCALASIGEQQSGCWRIRRDHGEGGKLEIAARLQEKREERMSKSERKTDRSLSNGLFSSWRAALHVSVTRGCDKAKKAVAVKDP